MADPNPSTRRQARRTFLVERFWPGVTPALAEAAAARLREAAVASPTASGAVPLRSALLPADEVVLAFVRADSVASVRALSESAGFAADRISETVLIDRAAGRGA